MPHRPRLNETEKRAWLRLIRSTQIGPVAFHNILRYYGSAERALQRLPDMAERGGGKRRIVIADERAIDQEFKALAACQATLLAWGEPEYPVGLMQLEDAPPLLAVRGDPTACLPAAVAIVGARNASAIAQRFTRDIAAALCSHGFGIISGLARGIDTAAHVGALQSAGKTVAFIGTGIDIAFPPENAALQEQLAEQGAVFAEMPPGTPPLAQNFPRRNRLISGASLGILVVEAAMKSGSLITARIAAEQGREVMAVPGSPLDPRCHGSNDLIRNGATLVERVDDVLAVLARPTTIPQEPEPAEELPMQEAPDDLAVIHAELDRLLSPTPVLIDDLIQLSGLSSGSVNMALTEKELAGRLQRHPGGRVSRI